MTEQNPPNCQWQCPVCGKPAEAMRRDGADEFEVMLMPCRHRVSIEELQITISRVGERGEIQNAADLSGEAWLYYVARYAEPSMTPDAWAEALAMSRQIVADYNHAHDITTCQHGATLADTCREYGCDR